MPDNWKKEVREALRHEAWTHRGPGRVVKVVPLEYAKASEVTGYIAQGKSLLGKTPYQICVTHGLPFFKFRSGMRVYSFKRLPMPSEYEYELTCAYPDGSAFNPAQSNPDYPPGDPGIHQWRIKDSASVPVDSANALELKPWEMFPDQWLLR